MLLSSPQSSLLSCFRSIPSLLSVQPRWALHLHWVPAWLALLGHSNPLFSLFVSLLLPLPLDLSFLMAIKCCAGGIKFYIITTSTFIAEGGEERVFFLEPKIGSADGWPASGRPAGGGVRARWRGRLPTVRAELLFGGCRTRGCRATRASRLPQGHCEHCSPGGGGGTCCRLARCWRQQCGRSTSTAERAKRLYRACKAVLIGNRRIGAR